MKRTSIALLIILAAAIAAAFWLRPARPKDDLSFLVIVVDSLRADHIGAYGYPRPTSPAIDALARDGLLFEAAFSQAPWTRPSVASIFTSTYISVHRVLYSEQIVDGQERTDVLNEKFLTLAEALKAGGFATGGFGKKIHLQPEFGFSQGFDGYDMNARRAPKVNQRTLSWLRHGDPDRFFIYLHYNDPHYPYRPVPEYARFGATHARVQINGATKAEFREGRLQLSPEDIRQLIDLYDGEIAYTDHHIGELLRGIEDLGYRNLLVILTADHGEEFLDHGDITHGQSLYNELVRVPFVVGGSGLHDALRSRRLDIPVQLIDIMPTLIDLAGLPMPPGLQGASIASLLRGADVPASRPHAFSQRRDPGDSAFSETITDGRWKIIRDATAGRTMIFDLQSDPAEARPAAADADPDLMGALTAAMDRWATANESLYGKLRPEQTTPLDPETEEKLRSLGYIH